MSDAQHTPGPWFVFGNGHCVGGSNTDPTTRDDHPTAGIAMCSMARRAPEENAANALLIAAAPDLLEALRPFVQHNSSDQFISLWVPTAAITRARAAIAKATGVAS